MDDVTPDLCGTCGEPIVRDHIGWLHAQGPRAHRPGLAPTGHLDYVKRLIEMGHLNFPASTEVDPAMAMRAIETAVALDHPTPAPPKGDTDDLIGPERRALFAELDDAYKAASAALKADDMDAWVQHAGRGAELHEELARRFGWRSEARP